MHPFWRKVFSGCTHFEEKFSLDAPILKKSFPWMHPFWLYMGDSKTVPPRSPTATRRTTLTSPWSVGCAADKKGIHFLYWVCWGEASISLPLHSSVWWFLSPPSFTKCPCIAVLPMYHITPCFPLSLSSCPCINLRDVLSRLCLLLPVFQSRPWLWSTSTWSGDTWGYQEKSTAP